MSDKSKNSNNKKEDAVIISCPYCGEDATYDNNGIHCSNKDCETNK